MIQETANNLTNIIDSGLETYAQELDALFLEKYSVTTQVKDSLLATKSYLLNNSNNLWSDLPIFISSFKVKDQRPAKSIKDKLIRYMSFFTKMLTDDGIARSLVTSRNFSNRNNSSTTDKNYYSETPQIELTNFEEGIKYASNLGKNESTLSSGQAGTSGETVTSKSWDEELKNLRFTFYNDLVDFIVDIPNVLYNYYSLDSRPALEIQKARFDYYKQIFEL